MVLVLKLVPVPVPVCASQLVTQSVRQSLHHAIGAVHQHVPIFVIVSRRFVGCVQLLIVNQRIP